MAIYVTFMRAAKALSSLHICASSPEPSALDIDNTIRTTIPCAGSNGDLSATSADSEYAGESQLHSEPLKQYLNLMCWLTW